MERQDFDYPLPAELIAQEPLARRGASRLLCLPAQGPPRDLQFTDLPSLLRPGDLLVLNDTRVIPARLFGHKPSGGRVEVLVERIRGEHHALVHLRAAKPPRVGTVLLLEGGVRATLEGREGELFHLRFSGAPVADVLARHGHMPLPPYIRRADRPEDRERYQTVFARRDGAVAAPTAGLHFEPSMLARLRGRGVKCAFVTLHVGAGTFQPMRVARVEEHRMHSEWLEVSEAVCRRVAETRRAGGRVVAVGTTVVRSLEAAARGGTLCPYRGETDIFIYPGFEFRVVDALVTNFHLPQSTLLMLTCAFGGHRRVMAAYHQAVAQRYRFFSYGDAMFIERAAGAGEATWDAGAGGAL